MPARKKQRRPALGGATPRAVGGYCRVSTDRQADEGVSLDVQERTIVQYCALRGWPAPALYVDAGESAYAENAAKRPAFRRLMADAEARALDMIVVVQLDRWARSLVLTIESLARLSEADCAFVSIAESIDFGTPIGRMALAMLAAIYQYQSDAKSEESSRVQAALWSDGRWQWRPPFGATIGPGGRLTLDPATAPLLERCLRLVAEIGPHPAADLLTAEGVPPPGARSAADRWGDTARPLAWWPGTLADMVDKGLWLADQREPFPALWVAARNRPKVARTRAGRRTHMLTGLMRCAGCGGPVGQFPVQGDPLGRRRPRCLWRGRPGRPPCWQSFTWSERYEAGVIAAVGALPDPEKGTLAPDLPDSGELAALAEEKRKLGVVYRTTPMGDPEYQRELAGIVAREMALLRDDGRPRALLASLPAFRRGFRGLPPDIQNAALREYAERAIIGADGAAVVVWRPFVVEACGLAG